LSIAIVLLVEIALAKPRLSATPLPAPHEGSHEQIEQACRLIEEEPGVARFHLQRARLYRDHGDYELAVADIEKAAALEPGLEGLDIVRARIYIDLGWKLAARVVIDRHLASYPEDGDALVMSAKLHRETGDGLAALAQFDQGIPLLGRQTPEHYVERAELATSLGDGYTGRAIIGLEQGVEQLGPAVSLVLALVDLEVGAGRYDSALERIRGLAAVSQRKERWLAREGEILAAAGRRDEALSAYKQCRSAIDRLMPAQRKSKKMINLAAQIAAKIEELEAASNK